MSRNKTIDEQIDEFLEESEKPLPDLFPGLAVIDSEIQKAEKDLEDLDKEYTEILSGI